MGLFVVLVFFVPLTFELLFQENLNIFFQLGFILSILCSILFFISDFLLLDLSLFSPFEVVFEALELEDLLARVFNLVLGGGTLQVIGQTGIIKLVALTTLEQAESVPDTTWHTVLRPLLHDLLWISVLAVLKLSKY